MKFEATLRAAKPDDIPGIIRLYAQTVLTVCRAEYATEQLHVWARLGRDPLRWEQRISNQFFLVAESGRSLVGFGSLSRDNYLDVFYVSKDHQRKGIANLLFSALLEKAMLAGIPMMTADVSKTAKPFFEKKGFRVVEAQENLIEEVV